MSGDDAAGPERLNAYLDRLADRADAAPTPPDVDPSFLETVRRLRKRDDARGADPAFARQLLEELMHTAAVSLPSPMSPGITTATNGRRPSIVNDAPASGARSTAKARIATHLATAALLVVTLGGIFVSFVPSSPGRDPDGARGIVVDPDAPSESRALVFLNGTLPVDLFLPPPTAYSDVWFGRFEMEPGTRIVVPADEVAGAQGVSLDVVVHGVLSKRLAGPGWISRDSGATWEATVPGQEVVVAPGEALLHRLDHLRGYGAGGGEQLSTLSMMIWTTDAATVTAPATLVSTDLAARHLTLPITRNQAPLAIRMERIDVESGTLLPDSPPGDIRLLGRMLPVSGQGQPETYVLTLRPLGDSTATPAASTLMIETLVDVALTADDTLPEPFDLQIWFGSVAPGGRVKVSAGYFRDTPATNVEYVLEGTLVVRVEGPLRIVRAGAAPETIPSGTEVVLGPGDAAVFSLETAFELVNPTQSLVRLLGAGVLSASFTPVAPGYGLSRFAYTENAALPSGPLHLALQRATLEPGATIPPTTAGELRVTLLESVTAIGLRQQPDGALGNPNPDAVIVYVLTLGTTDSESSTPSPS